MNTNYPSKQEILQLIKPQLDWIEQQTVYAEYQDPTTQPIHYREVVGEKVAVPAMSARRWGVGGSSGDGCENIGEAFFEFLREVSENPNATISEHYQKLGWGCAKGNRISRKLKEAGYIGIDVVKNPNPRGGAPKSIAVVTPAGAEFLKNYEQRSRNA